jgi:cytochrome c556
MSKKVGVRVVLAAVLLCAAGCTNTPPPEPELGKPSTIKEIMDSMVEPSADFLFDSVAQVADEHGITYKAPQTDDEWQEVRRRAVTLLEAPNLVVMHGRKVAPADDKSKNPEIELEPAQIQALIDGDRQHFVERAAVLQAAATQALKAIDAKDKDALFQACDRLDKACENCHLVYWYPNDKRAQEAARKYQ